MANQDFEGLLKPYEDIWMEKNIISSYVNDQGGSIENILFNTLAVTLLLMRLQRRQKLSKMRDLRSIFLPTRLRRTNTII